MVCRTLLDARFLGFVDDELLELGFVFVGELGDVELGGLQVCAGGEVHGCWCVCGSGDELMGFLRLGFGQGGGR